MATIYKFQDSEPVVTSSSTQSMLAADPVLIFSTGNSRTGQSTVGSVSCMMPVTLATSATTATNISNYGYTSLGSSSGPITAWLINAPVAGVVKTIRNTSTSTANTVATASTAVTFNSTGSNQIIFNGTLGYVDLIGVSSTVWHITAQSSASVAYTTFP